MLIDLVNQTQVSVGLSPATQTGTSQGSAVDLANVQEPLGAVVQWGTPGAGQTTATVAIEECETTNGTFTTISGMVTTITGTLAGVAVLRGMRSKQFARGNLSNIGGTTPSLPVSVILIGQRKFAPPGSGVDRYPSS